MKLKHLFLVAFLFVAGMVSAQQLGSIPVNKNVRQGKLSNGLTYYILHNEWPEHVANFYIAQRVGSIQEEENQRGLAHFLEHMASTARSISLTLRFWSSPVLLELSSVAI